MTDYYYPVLSDEINLPMYVLGVGARDKEFHFIREEGYPNHQIVYCIRGGGVLKLDGQEYPVAAGDAFYLPPHIPHEYYPSEDIWETHWITFEGREVKPVLDYIKLDRAKVFHIHDINAVDAIFKKILYLMKTNYYYRRDLTLVELSDLIDLSPQYLCRLFKECLNMRPFEDLARKRIQQAKLLLLEDQKNINEIAAMVGYNDCSYFCAVFKRHEMLSPAEFRSLHKKANG